MSPEGGSMVVSGTGMIGIVDARRLRAFGARWRERGREGSPAWVSRLAALAPIVRRLRPTAPVAHLPPPGVDPARLRAFAGSLRTRARQVDSRHPRLNPWSAAGLRRVEVRNAAVLANLWEHGGEIGLAFLDAFFRRVDRDDRLPGRDQLAAGYRVRIEDCPLGQRSERVDITVEGKDFLVGIEVKIDAPPGHLQLERYVKTIRTRAGSGRRWAVILLARRAAERTDVVPARWHDVALAADQAAAQAGRDDKLAWLVAEFGAHVRTFKER